MALSCGVTAQISHFQRLNDPRIASSSSLCSCKFSLFALSVSFLCIFYWLMRKLTKTIQKKTTISFLKYCFLVMHCCRRRTFTPTPQQPPLLRPLSSIFKLTLAGFQIFPEKGNGGSSGNCSFCVRSLVLTGILELEPFFS